MRIPALSLPLAVAVAATFAAPPLAGAQAVALPLRGKGEFTLADKQYDLHYGSVLLQADSSVKAFLLDSGSPRTIFAGEWRFSDPRTIRLVVHTVLGDRSARGSGRIHLGADGLIDALEVRGQAEGRDFSARFENGVSTAAISRSERRETGALPPSGQSADEWPWGGTSLVLDVTRRGEGRLHDSEGGDYRLDRARLRLGQNDEFELVILGDSTYELAGTWSGDLRFGPVPLELREAFGRRVQGMGRVWIRDRSWDRDFSLERVELDGWNGDHRFALYFEAETPWGDPGRE